MKRAASFLTRLFRSKKQVQKSKMLRALQGYASEYHGSSPLRNGRITRDGEQNATKEQLPHFRVRRGTSPRGREATKENGSF